MAETSRKQNFPKGEERLDTGIRVLKATRDAIREFQAAYEEKMDAKLTDDLFVKRALKHMWAELNKEK